MIRLRRARETDAAGVYEVHTRAIRELCASDYTAPEIDAWAGRLVPGAHLDAIRLRYFVVAIDAGGIVGFGQLDLDHGEIEAVYVHPVASRRGVGTQLLEALEARARQATLGGLHLDASLNSVPFYERRGFRAHGRTFHPVTPGCSIACVPMRKTLGDRRRRSAPRSPRTRPRSARSTPRPSRPRPRRSWSTRFAPAGSSPSRSSPRRRERSSVTSRSAPWRSRAAPPARRSRRSRSCL